MIDNSPEGREIMRRALEWQRNNPEGSPEWNRAADRPAPQYNGPTSPLQAATQGQPAVDEELPALDDNQTPVGGLAMGDGADVPMTIQTPYDFMAEQQRLSRDALAAQTRMAERRDREYDAATEALKKRRYGPSASEQLFALSAALAKPTYGRSFGEIMGNVMPALADITRANREAKDAREQAMQALRQRYLGEQEQGDLGSLEMRRKLHAAMAPLVAARERAAHQTTPLKSVIVENGIGYDPISGEKIVQPSEAAWQALSGAPTKENLDNFIRTFGPRFAEKAQRIVGSAMGGQ